MGLQHGVAAGGVSREFQQGVAVTGTLTVTVTGTGTLTAKGTGTAQSHTPDIAMSMRPEKFSCTVKA